MAAEHPDEIAPSPLRWLLHGPLLVLFSVIAVVHQRQFWNWYIEDAAISFAFARNWAWGEGLVAYPGGERLEGYSNFTWVAVLAVGELLGFDSFDTSKVVQAALGCLTVPLVYFLAREAAPSRRSHAPLVAAAYFALASTNAIWSACGLENALFNFLMAAALLRSAIEVRTGRFPWAAFLWFLVAISRPEAILYCAVAGFLSMCFTLPKHGDGPTLKWLFAFFVPFGVYHAIRYWYFAFEFPQTYYGKMNTKEPKFAWNTRGWRYLRNWSHDLWTGYFLPLWIFAISGLRGARGAIGVVLLVVTAFVLIYPSNEALDTLDWWPDLPKPDGWVNLRGYVLVFDLFALLLLGINSRRGWQARALCMGICGAVVFFSVYTLGDWMKSWRWMSLLQVPAAVLFALGAGALADVLDRGFSFLKVRGLDFGFWAFTQVLVTVAVLLVGDAFAYGMWSLVAVTVVSMSVALIGALFSRTEREPATAAGWTLLALLGALVVLPNAAHTKAVLPHPETGPFAIKKRVEWVRNVKDTLEIDGRIVDLDVDQGAHLWWGRDDFAMMDIAGLVDIPMAQHRFQRPFIAEYIFKERRPHYAHVHGGWASNSRIPSHPEWRTDYYEIPGYPAGRTKIHPGNHIRRDLVMRTDYEGQPERRVEFEGGVSIEGFDLPSEPAQARVVWIEIAVRDTVERKKHQDIGLTMFASRDGELSQVWDIPLGYGWFEAQDWRVEETNVGKYKLPIPKHMALGSYDIGFVVTDGAGRYLSALTASEQATIADGSEDNPAVFATGEVRFSDVLKVVDLDTLAKLAKQDRLDAIEHASQGRCEDGEKSWFLSKKHRPIDKKYLKAHGGSVDVALAACWAKRTDSNPEDAPALMERARRYDHHSPAYLERRAALADPLYAEAFEHLEIARERALTVSEAEDDSPEQLDLRKAAVVEFDRAYAGFVDVLRIDPWRSWARRYAEEARAYRLGLDEESQAREEARKAERKRKAQERRDNARERQKRNKQKQQEAKPKQQPKQQEAKPPTPKK